jgi:hypothetical protein
LISPGEPKATTKTFIPLFERKIHMRRLTLALSLVPTLAFAQVPPQPTQTDIAQAGAATAADLAGLVVQLRAQLLADQRDIAARAKEATATRPPIANPDLNTAH